MRDKKYETRVIMDTLDLLTLAKEMYSYAELSERVGLTVTVLCRYEKGRGLPSFKRALEMRAVLRKKLDLEEIIRSDLKWNHGHLDTSVVRTNTRLLRMAISPLLDIYKDRITTVLSSGQDSDYFASSIASFLGALPSSVMEHEEMAVDTYDVVYSADSRHRPMIAYVPMNSVEKHNNVLLASVLIDTGKIEKALINLIEEKAKFGGVVGLLGSGYEYEATLGSVQPTILYQIPASFKKS